MDKDAVLQEWADYACCKLAMPQVKIVVKGGVRQGRAHLKTHSATVPAWAFRFGIGYAVYYTLHEITHFVVWKHGEAFKSIERYLCEKAGIALEYRRVFPDAITFEGQRIVCTKKAMRNLL